MSPRQPFSYLVVLSFVAFLACAAAPALGDVSIPTNTYVYFEQGGAPYNGSVQYTVTCYGYTAYPGSPSFSSHTAPENTSETVYSYSASCPGYGCVVYEPYYLNYRHIERCDLSGTAGNHSFSVAGFATTPMPSNCTMLHPYDIGMGTDEYYNTTPEYETCMNATYEESDRCSQYMAECDPAKDTECGNWIIDGRYVRNTDKAIACRDAADKNRTACEVYLEKVDPSTMLMYRDNWSGQMMPAMRVCDQHFTIPVPGSGNATPAVQNVNTGGRSPVESLYCGILSLFGAGC
jgi:hypothetical protein